MMICSKAFECKIKVCTHRKPHEENRRCLYTCPEYDGYEVICYECTNDILNAYGEITNEFIEANEFIV